MKQPSNETTDKQKKKNTDNQTTKKKQKQGNKSLCHTRLRGKGYFELEILAARPGGANLDMVQRVSAALACTSGESFKIHFKDICLDTNQPISKI